MATDDDAPALCVNLRILSRLSTGEKLRSVRDKYYAVENGDSYVAGVLRWIRSDGREETCDAIEVRPRFLRAMPHPMHIRRLHLPESVRLVVVCAC